MRGAKHYSVGERRRPHGIDPRSSSQGTYKFHTPGEHVNKLCRRPDAASLDMDDDPHVENFTRVVPAEQNTNQAPRAAQSPMHTKFLQMINHAWPTTTDCNQQAFFQQHHQLTS